MLAAVNNFLKYVDDLVWGVPLIVAILLTGIYLTIRLKGIQITKLPKALKYMFENEESGHGEVTSFGALCTALSATIGTGNIVGVATAIVAGGPGALFWMEIAALFGMATKYSEGLLAIKYRTTDKHGHILGGPFYYIENGMGKKWTWLAKIFAFFGMGVGLFGIGTFTQVNGITSAVGNFFDPNAQNVIHLLGRDYTLAVVISGLILTVCVGLVVIGGLKRIAKVSEIIVPFMAVIYIAISLLLLILSRQRSWRLYPVPLVCVQQPAEHLERSLWQCRKVSQEVSSQTRQDLVVPRSQQQPLRQKSRHVRDWLP